MKSFNFHMNVAKAERDEKGFYLRGVSSTTDIDKHQEVMAPSALDDMKKYVGQIPLTNSHNNELENQIGQLVEAEVKDGQFITVFKMDEDDDVAMRLYNKIAAGANCGFSVGGKILSTAPGLEKGAKRIIQHVELDHIALTKKPANPNTFANAFQKCLDEIEIEEAQIMKDATTLLGEALELLKTESESNLAKIGAKFSADTMAALSDIHSKLGELMGVNTVVIGADNDTAKKVDPVAGGGPAEIDNEEADEANNSGNVTAAKTFDKDEITALIKSAIVDNVVPLLKSERASLVSNEEKLVKSAADEYKESKSIMELQNALRARLSAPAE